MLDGLLVRVILGACLACMASAMPAAGAQKIAVRVPFVGCRSDGQLGPEKAPIGKSKVVPIAAGKAARLAYYKAEEGDGVLAPRGWYCFGTYGSSGESLYVSPNPIGAADLLSTWGPVFSSAVIEITDQYGGTSGRFGVADMIARVFPAHRAFVDAVTDEEVREGIHPPSSFPSGPYPKDKLTYRSKDLVEYETSAETEGLGTQSRLLKNGDPICGVAMLVGQTPDLVHLSVRLPLDVTDLAPLIIQQVERDAANSRGN
jgi:hypothetical protein